MFEITRIIHHTLTPEPRKPEENRTIELRMQVAGQKAGNSLHCRQVYRIHFNIKPRVARGKV